MIVAVWEGRKTRSGNQIGVRLSRHCGTSETVSSLMGKPGIWIMLWR